MSHLKRHKVPKNWPIHRKGTTFVIKPGFGNEQGIPILIALRDALKIAQNRKEVKGAIHLKNILLNGKVVKDEKNSALLYDTITIVPSKKSYRIELSSNGKFMVNEVKDSGTKVSKIADKKTLKGKKTQLNLSDGRNFISDLKCNVGDSVLIDFKSNKPTKCLPFKEKANVLVIAGKHTGAKGTIDKIIPERKMAEVTVESKKQEISNSAKQSKDSSSKDKINVLIKQLMVIE